MLKNSFDGASGKIELDSGGGVKRVLKFFSVVGATFKEVNDL